MAEELADGGVNRVLLLTDGLANVGIKEPGQLRDLIGSAAAKGVSTTTIGFEAITTSSFSAPSPRPAAAAPTTSRSRTRRPRCSRPRSRASMALAAQNVTVTVAPAAAVEHATVLHQYPRQQPDDRSLRLELGDLYALEPKSLLCELLLTSDVDAPEIDVATLTIEGYVLLPNGGVEKKTVKLPIAELPSSPFAKEARSTLRKFGFDIDGRQARFPPLKGTRRICSTSSSGRSAGTCRATG